MLVKNIKYTDFNGVEREEKFLFNLTKAEIMEMELGTTGGLTEQIKKMIETQDAPKIQKIFKDIILKAYGEKSDDGRRFMKVDDNGRPLSLNFSQTEAYSVLYMELVTDPKASSDFIKGIIPSDIDVDSIAKDKNIDLGVFKNVESESKDIAVTGE